MKRQRLITAVLLLLTFLLFGVVRAEENSFETYTEEQFNTLFKKETCDQIKGEVNACEKIEFDLKEQYIIRSKIDPETNQPTDYNCLIKREKVDDKSIISISC